MQSYMNSLNESASVDMEMSPPSDAPCSPESDGAAPVPQSYSGGLLNSDEKLLKMAASSGNANMVSFQNGSVQEAAISHSATQTQTEQDNMTSSYSGQSNCLVGHNNNNNANPKVDNTKYTFPSNQNQCPFSGVRSPQSNSISQNSFQARESHNQSPCPWKLNGGAKVLVRPFVIQRVNHCLSKTKEKVHRFLTFRLSSRRARSTFVRLLRPAGPARRCGTLSPSASPLRSEKWWNLQKASQASRVSASTTRSCC